MEPLEAWLRFGKLDLGPRRAQAMIEYFGDPAAVLGATAEELAEAPDSSAATIERIRAGVPDGEVEQALRVIEQLEIVPICQADATYPSLLRTIHDPPVCLWVRGELMEADRFAVALVGSRKASSYGLGVAQRLSTDLARRGFTVVAGLARGIDTAAHRGALAQGRTIAVLGCGSDIAYPPENRALMAEITAKGALVSEYPPGTPPDAWRFPARNRIISGLSLGTVVCEAPARSGALITAEFAQEQGREVMAVPGNVDNPRNRGAHALIRDGARLVESAEDVLSAIGVLAIEPPPAQLALPLVEMADEEKRAMALLSLTARHVDSLAAELGEPVSAVGATLLMLELKGLVKRLPGGHFIRIAFG